MPQFRKTKASTSGKRRGSIWRIANNFLSLLLLLLPLLLQLLSLVCLSVCVCVCVCLRHHVLLRFGVCQPAFSRLGVWARFGVGKPRSSLRVWGLPTTTFCQNLGFAYQSLEDSGLRLGSGLQVMVCLLGLRCLGVATCDPSFRAWGAWGLPPTTVPYGLEFASPALVLGSGVCHARSSLSLAGSVSGVCFAVVHVPFHPRVATPWHRKSRPARRFLHQS